MALITGASANDTSTSIPATGSACGATAFAGHCRSSAGRRPDLRRGFASAVELHNAAHDVAIRQFSLPLRKIFSGTMVMMNLAVLRRIASPSCWPALVPASC